MKEVKLTKIVNFGMKDQSPGCSEKLLNGTPNAKQIVEKILKIIKEKI